MILLLQFPGMQVIVNYCNISFEITPGENVSQINMGVPPVINANTCWANSEKRLPLSLMKTGLEVHQL